MKKLQLLFCLVLLIGTIFPALHGVEKERLVSFLKVYDAREGDARSWGKVEYAIENNYPDIAEFLIRKNEPYSQYSIKYPLNTEPSNNKFNEYHKHPLITAITKGYSEVAQLLISTRASTEVEEYRIEYHAVLNPIQRYIKHRKNALIAAIEQNNLFIASKILEWGFDPNINKALNPPKNNESQFSDSTVYTTPLMRAIELKRLEIAKLLFKRMAEVDKIAVTNGGIPDINYGYPFCCTPLFRAVEDNYIEGIVLLLSHGANPLCKPPTDTIALSPFERAIQKGYVDVVDLLYTAMEH